MRDRMWRLGLAAAFVASLLIVQAGQALATAPSSAPTIKSPVNGSNVGNANPTLSWAAVGNAVYYRVQISTIATFSSTIYDVETHALQATPPSLLPFTTLYWRVAGEDSSHATGPFSTASFTKSLSSAPVPLTPTNGGTLIFPTDPVVFSWQPVPGAVSYTLRVGNSSDFTSNPVQYTTSNTSYTLTDTQSFTQSDGITPQSWWWEVQANYANSSVTQWSTPWSYFISWPATPQLESPSNGAVGVTDTVFSWDPVLGAATYEIQVSPNGDWQNNTIIDQTSVYGSRFAPDQTLDNSSYYWRVRARAAGSATNYGQWSTPFTFTRSWSSRPVTIKPHWTGGAADPPTVGNLELSWTPATAGGSGWVAHASHYELQIGTDLNFSPGTYTSCMTDQTTFTPYQPVIGGGEPGSCNEGPSLSIGSIYYWRVRGIDGPAGVLGLWDSTSSADTQRFIYQPSLPDLSCGPASGSHVQTPVLCWSAVSGAETYRVTILRHDGTQADQAVTYGLSYTPLQALNPSDSPFTWHVETIDSQSNVGLIQASSSWPSFYLDAPTTNTSLSLLTPLNGASALRMPSMTWTPYTGASYYEVLYGVTSGIFNATPLSGGTHLLFAGFTYTAVPKAAAKYYWEVEAFDAGDNLLKTSSMGSFYVGTTPSYGDWIIPWNDYLTPECQAQTDPSISRCTPLLGQTQEMTWTPDPNAGAYLVYVAKDVNFTNIYREYETGQTSLTPRESWLDSQAGESYYWFVRPCVDWQAQHCGPGPDTNAGLDNSSAYRKSSPAENGLTTTTAANPPVAATTIPNQVTFNWADYMTTSQASPYPVTGMKSTRVTQEAKQYTIQVSTTSDFTNIIDTRTVDQTQYTPWTETYPEGPLYWRVQALDGSGNPLTMQSHQVGNQGLTSDRADLADECEDRDRRALLHLGAADMGRQIHDRGLQERRPQLLRHQPHVQCHDVHRRLVAHGEHAGRRLRLAGSANRRQQSSGSMVDRAHVHAPAVRPDAQHARRSSPSRWGQHGLHVAGRPGRRELPVPIEHRGRLQLRQRRKPDDCHDGVVADDAVQRGRLLLAGEPAGRLQQRPEHLQLAQVHGGYVARRADRPHRNRRQRRGHRVLDRPQLERQLHDHRVHRDQHARRQDLHDHRPDPLHGRPPHQRHRLHVPRAGNQQRWHRAGVGGVEFRRAHGSARLHISRHKPGARARQPAHRVRSHKHRPVRKVHRGHGPDLRCYRRDRSRCQYAWPCPPTPARSRATSPSSARPRVVSSPSDRR